MRAPISININDSHIGIWQDNANDPSFRAEIYSVLIRDMRARGWSIKHDPNVRRHYRSLNPDRRLGARRKLRCDIEISGRQIKVEFWSVIPPQTNRNGRRYEFDKLARMHHIDQLRVEVEFRCITRWLATLAPTTVARGNRGLTPIQRIEKGYAESWHKDKTLGRPICSYDYNRKAADGALLEHGQTVWATDMKGRVIRGTAYYNINNMWWVVAGGALLNEACHSLFHQPPADLRVKQNERLRRTRLERELAIAVERMDFQRAMTLKQVLFGGEPTFLIWARGHGAYYRSQYAGYTTDRVSAGKYTRAEAEAECRRVSHELEMVCPDGSHVRFDRKAA